MITTTFYAQAYEPLDVAKKIFGKEPFPEIEAYATAEYQGYPNGQDLQNEQTTRFILLEQTDKTAVVALTIFSPSESDFDLYLHFVKDNVWQLAALRNLAQTGILEQMKQAFDQMTLQDIDRIIEESKRQETHEFVLFGSREEYEFLRENTKLTLASDDQIIAHFHANRPEFERLKQLALNEVETGKNSDLLENLKADYQKLFILSVSADDYQMGNSIRFIIGGILDNTVGYMYVKNKEDLPKMSPNAVIMLREIGNGWYIYKTT